MKELEIFKKPLFWLVLILILIWAATLSLPDHNLHLVFCNVGQGDGILISYQKTQVLIDGGPDEKILECLSKKMPFWDRKIEMVVLTHPEEDHFGGLIEVIKRYDVMSFVVNSLVNDKPSFWEFYQVVLEEKAPVYSPKVGEKIKIGALEFLVLWPQQKLGDGRMWNEATRDTLLVHTRSLEENSAFGGEERKLTRNGHFVASVLSAATVSGELNDTSIVLQLSFGHFCTLLTGDIPSKIEDQLGDVDPCQVLKVAHHGSKFSTSQVFLQKVKPQLAIISVGKNRFGHPTEEVINRLKNLKIKTLRTDQEGEIEIVSDGRQWYNAL